MPSDVFLNPTGRLANKVALITGTGGGQGRVAALVFASEGATIVGCDLVESAATETVRLVRAAGGEIVSTQPLDLTSLENTRAWVDRAVQDHGQIDILYNNAAAARGSAFGELDPEDWVFTLRNELDVVFNACQAV